MCTYHSRFQTTVNVPLDSTGASLNRVCADTSPSPGTHLYGLYSKHEFVYIPIAAVHNNTGSVYKYGISLEI